MSGSVHISFYATLFRGDKLHSALEDIAKKSSHFGATAWAVYRYRDDRYKFLVTFDFDSKAEWDRYWTSQDFLDFRIANQSYYQVPLLYSWTDKSSNETLAAALAVESH
ncbi:MAG TPA: hypothetical protein VNT22_02865 [Baekduia sp.]|nr:hypothetical protein [Baekduia sp.]